MFIVDKEIINKKYFIESETKTMKETKTTKATTKETESKATKKATEKKQVAKTESKAKAKTEEKAKKVTFSQRREKLMQEINLKDCIQYETEKTALNKVDSAMLLYDNAIMLTLVSTETNKASRVLEIWIHAKRNDICISKRLFDSLTEKDEKIKAYSTYIDEKAKSSKYVLKLESDEITKQFVNEFIKAI